MAAIFRSAGDPNDKREAHHKYGAGHLRDMLHNLLQRNQYAINKTTCYDKRVVEKISKEVEKVVKLCSQTLVTLGIVTFSIYFVFYISYIKKYNINFHHTVPLNTLNIFPTFIPSKTIPFPSKAR